MSRVQDVNGINKAVAREGATGAGAPPFQKKKESTFIEKYNMNKQNFDLTFLGKFIY